MAEWASRADIEAAAEHMTDAFVDCRAFNHPWRPLTVHQDEHGYVIVQRCARCRSEREADMDFNGFIGSWRRRYPEGYLLQGVGRMDGNGRAAMRLATLRHQTVRPAK